MKFGGARFWGLRFDVRFGGIRFGVFSLAPCLALLIVLREEKTSVVGV